MSFLECPYCFRKAASMWDLGQQIYVMEPNKKCPHCLGPIEMNLPVFSFIIYSESDDLIFV